jgi:hypothetical protein
MLIIFRVQLLAWEGLLQVLVAFLVARHNLVAEEVRKSHYLS